MEEKQNKQISEEKALSRMMNICAKKEYCTFDIKQKLYKLNLPSEAIDRVIIELINKKFIDNARYTRSFISDKSRFSKWGLRKIKYSLKLKQIPDSVIDEVLEELEPNQFTKDLQPIIEQKMKSVKGNTEYEKRAKVIRFALGRGFEMNDIIKCLDKISPNEDFTW